jgi:hypothetical protein
MQSLAQPAGDTAIRCMPSCMRLMNKDAPMQLAVKERGTRVKLVQLPITCRHHR